MGTNHNLPPQPWGADDLSGGSLRPRVDSPELRPGRQDSISQPKETDIGMKRCKGCGCDKPMSEFGLEPKVKSGLKARCLDCARLQQRKWAQANPEKKRDAIRSWRERFPERQSAATQRWRAANRERTLNLQRDFRAKHPEKISEQQSRRWRRMKNSTPHWVSDASIAALYERAAILTAITGVRHEVDHIVPLAGKNVSGLTVPWNLRVVPYVVNARKGTKILEEGVAA